MLTFEQAREALKTAWPDYEIASYGYDAGEAWILVLLPETAGGRVPLVSKSDGSIRWIQAYSPEYTQEHPVGDIGEGRP